MIGLRVLTASVCGVDLGLTLLLFMQVGRYFVPRFLMRGLMAAAMLVTATIGVANLQHVHRPPTWLTWALAVGMFTKAAFMAGLVHWYGSTAGREHTAAMLAVNGQRRPRTATDRRIDQLVVGMIAGLVIALFALLVVGVNSIRNGHDERRTHAQLVVINTVLCAYRDGLQDSVNQGNAFLATHTGRTILGIPRAQLVQNIRTQQTRLDTLSGLRCRPPS